MRIHSAHPRRGFTLLELIVVISVLVALSAVLIPAVQGVLEDSKVAEVASLYDTMKKSCLQYHLDTARYAIEYSGSAYAESQYHELALSQTHTGWRGPYLEEALGSKANPWNGAIHLYGYLLVNSISGWDLDNDGTAELTTQESANVLYLTAVPEDAAEQIDEAIDKADLAAGATWDAAGRVVYNSSQQALWILILRKD